MSWLWLLAAKVLGVLMLAVIVLAVLAAIGQQVWDEWRPLPPLDKRMRFRYDWESALWRPRFNVWWEES